MKSLLNFKGILKISNQNGIRIFLFYEYFHIE